MAFLNFLPLGKHFHMITGLPNVYFKRLTPSGQLSKPNLEAEEFGVKTIKDFTWKQALDVYSCTECGRCQTHCPTYVTGKPLTHKEVNRTLKHHLLDVGDDLELKATPAPLAREECPALLRSSPTTPSGPAPPAAGARPPVRSSSRTSPGSSTCAATR